MKFACTYAIVRFLPYAETGEFANVGIVLACQQTGYFNFKLLSRTGRIRAFFEELDKNVFKTTQKAFAAELVRVCELLLETQPNGQQPQGQDNKMLLSHLFAETIRPREAMIRFAEPRVVLADDPDEKLTELYEHYIERNFATKQYQEKLIERQVQQTLRSADLMRNYSSKVLGNSAYHVRFPLVKLVNEKVQRVIKPIYLAQKDSTQLYDHGWEWIGKIRKLNREKMLPAAVLFAVDAPAENDAECFSAYNEIIDELENQNIQVISYDNAIDLVRFAQQ